MKKNILYLLGVMFLLIAGVFLQTARASALSDIIQRTVTNEMLHFADGRVRQMCHQWPTCEEWVNGKANQDPYFQVIDAEVERWVSKWENNEAIWEYRLYVQTKENNQIKAYLFTRGSKGFSYNAPVQIEHFPGHPFPGQPSQHIAFTSVTYTFCTAWPGYNAWATQALRKASFGQRIYRWNEQEDAVWEKNLYVEVGPNRRKAKAFLFRAYQTEAGGAFTFESPVEIRAYPENTRVSF